MHHGYSRQKVDVFGKHTFSCSSGSNSSAGSQLPNILLGVTNPFFTKALDHWPHIVKLGGGAGSSSPNDQPNGGSSPKTARKGHSPFKGHNGVGGSNHKKVHLGVFSKLGRWDVWYDALLFIRRIFNVYLSFLDIFNYNLLTDKKGLLKRALIDQLKSR